MKKRVIGIILCAMVCFVFAGCSLIETPDKPDKNSLVAQIGVGETATYNDVNWQIKEYRNAKSVPTVLGTPITTTDNFIRIELVVFNNRENTYCPKLSMIKLKMEEPIAYYTPKDYIYATNRMGTKDVAPQMEVHYQIIFETPYTTVQKDFVLEIKVSEKPYRVILINL